ncbi:alanine dehydrogenase [Paucilactobacillus wasatchensis]|uniref:Alanine dehydrogenase n=1 Tax=Paucilactobacillus wasatchensis TaxID=1335616 RepID=A0A0D0Y7R1_9LACO|nr:alanine dehydrogenase [Paucilactobacillus wasatchensis]KIS04303.1 Alanine dehydrogenase [Paucilactobacillus wasatchensis]
MKIGIPKEIKNQEDRVGMTPDGVRSLVAGGNDVIVQQGAGIGSGFTDQDYIDAGAKIDDVTAAWNNEMVIKVKEPIAEEYQYFKANMLIYTYLHLAPDEKLTQALLDSKVTGIAYETMVAPDNSLPLLVPMSQVAGKVSVQAGAEFLQKNKGGKGLLLGGVPGIRRGQVTVIGGGTVGQNAAEIAVGFGADVTLLDINAAKLEAIDQRFNGRVTTLISTPTNIADSVKRSDLVIGAVLIPGAKAPKLVSEEMIASMEPGSVVVDIPIDQGGMFATTDHATTHDDPVFVKHGVVHYAVANIPGAVPKTSTTALASATVRYAIEIAKNGLEAAAKKDNMILTGINTYQGHLINKAVAESQNKTATELASLI